MNTVQSLQEQQVPLDSGFGWPSCEHNHIQNAASSDPTPHSEHLVHITPPAIFEETEARLFRYDCLNRTYLLLDGEIHLICSGWGGNGYHNALPWDYDGNGDKDILFSQSCGPGIHRSVISVFNTTTKEIIDIDDDWVDQDIILVQKSNALGTTIEIHLAKLEYPYTVHEDGTTTGHYAYMTATKGRRVGTVSVKNGVPYVQK